MFIANIKYSIQYIYISMDNTAHPSFVGDRQEAFAKKHLAFPNVIKAGLRWTECYWSRPPGGLTNVL